MVTHNNKCHMHVLLVYLFVFLVLQTMWMKYLETNLCGQLILTRRLLGKLMVSNFGNEVCVNVLLSLL